MAQSGPFSSGVFLAVMLAAAGLNASSAHAGGESSAGGADDYRIVPAFFISPQHDAQVHTCYQVAKDFGVESTELGEMVRDAFSKWADYIGAKKLNIVPYYSQILTHLDLRAACAGDENLTVYFGVENDLVNQYKGQFAKPFGFAQLVKGGQYSDGSQSQGFIWIAPSNEIDSDRKLPSWSVATRDALAGLVLHEMGHVFGNGHVDGTVMTEKIGQYLENDSAPAQTSRTVGLYSSIDSQIELVPCMECRLAYSAAETFDPIQPPGQDSASDWNWTFKLLTGREPVPPLLIRYERLGSPQGSGKLTLMDATGSFEFPVAALSSIGQRTDSTPLFAGQGGVNFYSFGMSYYAQLKTLSGTEIPVAVNYNMDGKKAEILPLGQDFYPRPIFVSAD